MRLKANKYGAQKTTVDNITFDSKKEAGRYRELKLMEKAGLIRGLILQATIPCIVNGKKVCDYRADFSYIEGDRHIVEDVKGVKTPVYQLKKKLVFALHGITITEI